MASVGTVGLCNGGEPVEAQDVVDRGLHDVIEYKYCMARASCTVTCGGNTGDSSVADVVKLVASSGFVHEATAGVDDGLDIRDELIWSLKRGLG